MSTKIAIIGAGGMAAYHAKGFREAGAEIVALADVNGAAAEKAAAKHGITRVFSDVGEMLRTVPELDAVSIIVPNKFHAPLALQALKAGKHVFCEKPPALSAAEMTKMQAAAKAAKRTLMFNFNNRARPESYAMMEHIKQGTVGTINTCQAKWIRRTGIPGFGGWFTTKALSGGGPLIDLLHMIDLGLYFMGYPEPAHILARTFTDHIDDKSFKGPWGIPDVAKGVNDVEAAAHGFVTFKTGQAMSFAVSWAEMNKREEVSVVFQGTKAGGMVQRLFGIDGLDNTALDACELYTHDNGRPVNRSIIVPPDETMGRVRSAVNFVRTLEGAESPLNTPDQALSLMKIIDGAYKSAASGKPAALQLFSSLMKLNRKLRMGMIGGGRGAFIGAVHRMAARLDGEIDLVAGCFSSDPEKSRLSGEDLFLDPARVYGSYQEMAQKEAALPADRRIDFVSIVTRNNTHAPIAKAFLEAGFHVVCDKPLCFTLKEGLKLREVVRKSGKVFALTHNYTGYPMVKEARDWVRSGKLGKLLKVVVEYPQGYAITALEAGTISKIANWRMDPNVSGVSNCMGDIGTHAHNLARYITGLEVEEICAELSTFIPGRLLDDDGNCLVRFTDGVKGILFASQISSGEENNLNIRVFGTKGSLQWFQENPNELIFKKADAPQQVYRRGNSYVSAAAQGATRTPFAHPEGFIEAFANIYRGAAVAIADAIEGRKAPKGGYDFPTIDDGLAGMAFIETAVKSGKAGAKWTKFPKV